MPARRCYEINGGNMKQQWTAICMGMHNYKAQEEVRCPTKGSCCARAATNHGGWARYTRDARYSHVRDSKKGVEDVAKRRGSLVFEIARFVKTAPICRPLCWMEERAASRAFSTAPIRDFDDSTTAERER